MLFLSSDKSMFNCCNQSSEPLFTGQLLFHHQARPLTHPSLQWCWCCHSPVLFLRVCLSLSAFDPLSVPSSHGFFMSSLGYMKWLDGFPPCMPGKTRISIPVFKAHSISHHQLFTHPCSFIHPCICHSSSSSSSSIYCPSRDTCLRKDEERLSFLF